MTIVPVAYGLFLHDPEYSQAEETEFPNAWYYIPGGCVVKRSIWDRKRIVFYCPQCREIERQWREAHKKRQPPKSDVELPAKSEMIPATPFIGNYKVHKGDTLTAIARRVHDSDTLDAIVQRNDISNRDMIREGQILQVRYVNREHSEAQQGAPEIRPPAAGGRP